MSPEEASFRGREDGAAAVAAAEQTRGSEGADFRDGVGDAAAVEAAEQARSPEGAGFRDGVGGAATVEAAVQATCPEGVATGIREAGVAAGAGEVGDDNTGAGAARPDSPGDWRCPICSEDCPQHARVRPPCCDRLICGDCSEQIVQHELAAVRGQIRRNRRANGAQQRRRRLPFSCPFCRRRSALRSGAQGAARTPRARRSPGMSLQSVRLPTARSLLVPQREEVLTAILCYHQLCRFTTNFACTGPRSRPGRSRGPLCATPQGPNPQLAYRRSALPPPLGQRGHRAMEVGDKCKWLRRRSRANGCARGDRSSGGRRGSRVLARLRPSGARCAAGIPSTSS